MADYSQAQLDAATRAVHRVTGGGIPFAPKRRSRKPAAVVVSAALVAQAALDAAENLCPTCGVVHESGAQSEPTHGHEQEPRPLVTCPECEGECVVDGMEDADEDDDDETGDFFPAVVCPRCEGKGVDTLTDEEVADAANPALGAQSEPTQRQDRDSA